MNKSIVEIMLEIFPAESSLLNSHTAKTALENLKNARHYPALKLCLVMQSYQAVLICTAFGMLPSSAIKDAINRINTGDWLDKTTFDFMPEFMSHFQRKINEKIDDLVSSAAQIYAPSPDLNRRLGYALYQFHRQVMLGIKQGLVVDLRKVNEANVGNLHSYGYRLPQEVEQYIEQFRMGNNYRVFYFKTAPSFDQNFMHMLQTLFEQAVELPAVSNSR